MAKIDVSSNIRFMQIFAGVRWTGSSNKSGVGFFGDFRPILENGAFQTQSYYRTTIGKQKHYASYRMVSLSMPLSDP